MLHKLTPEVGECEDHERVARPDRRVAARLYPLEAVPGQHAGAVHAAGRSTAIYKATAGKAIIVADVGQHQMFAAQHFRFDGPNMFMTSGGLGHDGLLAARPRSARRWPARTRRCGASPATAASR